MDVMFQVCTLTGCLGGNVGRLHICDFLWEILVCEWCGWTVIMHSGPSKMSGFCLVVELAQISLDIHGYPINQQIIIIFFTYISGSSYETGGGGYDQEKQSYSGGRG